jgi:hypothetical protein
MPFIYPTWYNHKQREAFKKLLWTAAKEDWTTRKFFDVVLTKGLSFSYNNMLYDLRLIKFIKSMEGRMSAIKAERLFTKTLEPHRKKNGWTMDQEITYHHVLIERG